jgi:hypothetical protein
MLFEELAWQILLKRYGLGRASKAQDAMGMQVKRGTISGMPYLKVVY